MSGTLKQPTSEVRLSLCLETIEWLRKRLDHAEGQLDLVRTLRAEDDDHRDATRYRCLRSRKGMPLASEKLDEMVDCWVNREALKRAAEPPIQPVL